MKKTPLTLSLGLCGFLAFGSTLSTASPWPDDLFQASGAKTQSKVQLPRQAKGQRNRAAKVDLDVLGDESITLNLFDDTTLVAVRDRLVDRVRGRTVWIGHIEGEPESEVILAVTGKAMMGTVKRGEEQYQIVHSGDDTYSIRQIDPNVTLDDAASLNPDDPDTGAALLEEQSAPLDPTTTPDTATTIVDFMAVYTPKARANAGGTDGIEAKIVNAVEAANQAYLRSGVAMQLNLVHMAEVIYTETGDMTTSVRDLKGTTDGKMDEVHALRSQYGADQVSLITADANYCGIAYQLTSSWVGSASSFAANAFSAVHDDSTYACLSNHTLAHELGHNQGSNHNFEDAGGVAGAYADSYGYRLCVSGGFRTVMSYTCAGATRVGYFSNPNVDYGLDPTGIAGSADNARSLNATRTLVASWVKSTTPTAPTAPATLVATAQSESAIRLSWTDTSDNETGFRIQRSVDGVTWIEVATMAANVASFTDSGLAPATLYDYRIVAYNGTGTSAYSNTASAQTLATAPTVDTMPPTVSITKPGAGTMITGIVQIAVTGTDNVALKSLELRIDGKRVGVSTTGSLSYNWNTRKLSGTHSITAKALDKVGNASVATIQVSIGVLVKATVRDPRN